jgi:GH25 family lysozyme M1 (1,4-beta-N-acetylmuramidase)
MDTLKKGSSGSDVTTLQELLKITQDGQFGPKTKAAVIAFQAANGLTADGVVGNLTWEKLLPKGIDVSDYKNNTPIVNWANFDFLIIKATEGATFQNPQMNVFTEGARTNNKIVGYYLFIDNQYTAHQHADNLASLKIAWDAADTLPCFIDVEDQMLDDTLVTNDLPAAVQLVTDICSLVATLTGRPPIIYSYKGFWADTLGNPDLSQYALWDANVSMETMQPFGGWTKPLFWQFAQSGTDTDPYGGGDKDWSMFEGGFVALKALANPPAAGV